MKLHLFIFVFSLLIPYLPFLPYSREPNLTSQKPTESVTPTPELVRAARVYTESSVSTAIVPQATMVVSSEDLFIARGQSEMEVCLNSSHETSRPK